MQTVAGGISKGDELARLADLRDSGALTTEEFDQHKARLLG
jgi:Short C-terminal domain